jgi:hypothetical protein
MYQPKQKKTHPARTFLGLVALAGAIGTLIYVLNTKPKSLDQNIAELSFVAGAEKVDRLDAKKGERVYVFAYAESKEDILERKLIVNGKNSGQGIASNQYKTWGKTVVSSDSSGSLIITTRPEFKDGDNTLEYLIEDSKGKEYRSKPITLNLAK